MNTTLASEPEMCGAMSAERVDDFRTIVFNCFGLPVRRVKQLGTIVLQWGDIVKQRLLRTVRLTKASIAATK
jgi:hypothetical protein